MEGSSESRRKCGGKMEDIGKKDRMKEGGKEGRREREKVGRREGSIYGQLREVGKEECIDRWKEGGNGERR